VEKDATNTVTSDKRHLWDHLQIVEDRATDDSTVTKRFYGNGVELVTGPDAGTYTYRRDHLGSIREVVDSTGTLVARFDYTAWGDPELVSGAFDLDFRYTGHYHHQSSGLHLAPFRAYDTTLGRWLSADPIGEAGGINLYGYVENDPVNFIDPDGRHPVLAIPIIIGLFATTENAHAPANAEDQNVPPPGIALAAQAMFPPGAACARNGIQGLGAAKNVAKAIIPLTKSKFGHAFTTHGQGATNFLTNRAAASSKPMGQFLDDQAAAQLILDNLGNLKNGAISVPVPKSCPARVIMPDGTFAPASTIRLVPSGSGVKTAYPEL
ncbi:MAG: RHS repeat-associated core domain-containing protein, partial [Akkermansiaceae bacterium]